MEYGSQECAGVSSKTEVKKSILLHMCCGNCACFPYKFLKKEVFSVTGFWCNPNIHPYLEHQHRLNTAGYFAGRQGLKVIYHPGYDIEGFIEGLDGNFASSKRCVVCYRKRLDVTADIASKQGFSLFSTTLLYSVYQQHELIKEIGREIAGKYNIEFYYSDFRKGWQEGIEISKKMGLYRQSYCGCIFSEKEKYLKKK